MTFIKKLFDILQRDLTGKSWHSTARDDFFGEMTYFGFKDHRIGYWESELDIDGNVVSVIINSTSNEVPSGRHQQFVASLISNLDLTVEKIKPMMLEMLAKLVNFDRNADWHQLFRLSGIEVPLDAEIENDWGVSFECLVDTDGHYFTCCLKAGEPIFVTVDG